MIGTAGLVQASMWCSQYVYNRRVGHCHASSVHTYVSQGALTAAATTLKLWELQALVLTMQRLHGVLYYICMYLETGPCNMDVLGRGCKNIIAISCCPYISDHESYQGEYCFCLPQRMS